MALRENFPSSHIAWVVEEPSKTLLESQPEIDQVILFPRKRWTEGLKAIGKMGRSFKEMGQFVLELRKQKFDFVLDFHGIKEWNDLFSQGLLRGLDMTEIEEGNFSFQY
jgi:ADP-heptose:LPS heptosyltransferase